MHPYFPVETSIPGYIANSLSTPVILAIFATAVAAIVIPCCLLICHRRPDITRVELSTALWFVLCGAIHLGLEGHFALHEAHIAISSDTLSQLWKEYSLSDSRYLTRDSFVVCMETITAVFWGPLSFMCAYSIVDNRPWRHPLQAIISLGQLYGDVLYFATCAHQEMVFSVTYSRPEMYYYVGYYILLNSFWIWIPLILLLSSTRETTAVFRRVQELDHHVKSR